MPNIDIIDRPDNLAQSAHKALTRAIQQGDLIQEQIYSENEIAKSLGISRTPVREALIHLQREGLIVIVPQRGFQLRVPSEAEMQEVFALRRLLESFVAERLAREITPDLAARLSGLVDEQERVLNDPEEFLASDQEFHMLLPRLAALEQTHRMLLSLRGALWLRGVRALAVPERAAGVVAEHRALVAAIAAGDAAAASKSMQTHLRNNQNALKLALRPRD